eukprot:6207085-Pleurochrysis_carterae.AAC.4
MGMAMRTQCIEGESVHNALPELYLSHSEWPRDSRDNSATTPRASAASSLVRVADRRDVVPGHLAASREAEAAAAVDEVEAVLRFGRERLAPRAEQAVDLVSLAYGAHRVAARAQRWEQQPVHLDLLVLAVVAVATVATAVVAIAVAVGAAVVALLVTAALLAFDLQLESSQTLDDRRELHA